MGWDTMLQNSNGIIVLLTHKSLAHSLTTEYYLVYLHTEYTYKHVSNCLSYGWLQLAPTAGSDDTYARGKLNELVAQLHTITTRAVGESSEREHPLFLGTRYGTTYYVLRRVSATRFSER